MYRFFCSCVNNTIFIKCCAFHWHELELEHSVFVNYLAPFKSRKAILFVKWTAFFLPSSVWCLRQCRKYSYETLNIRTVSLFSDASTVFMENYNGTTHTHTPPHTKKQLQLSKVLPAYMNETRIGAAVDGSSTSTAKK